MIEFLSAAPSLLCGVPLENAKETNHQHAVRRRCFYLAIVCSVLLILRSYQPSLRFYTRRHSGLRSWQLSL
jgi:hypothetical protein